MIPKALATTRRSLTAPYLQVADTHSYEVWLPIRSGSGSEPASGGNKVSDVLSSRWDFGLRSLLRS
jgi:hypothetical protein